MAGSLPSLGAMRYLLGALIVLGVSCLVVSLPGTGEEDAPDRKWGPFRGRAVDADTGRPIAGAGVLVVWLWTPPGRSAQSFHDARAAVTGADGGFEVPRRPPPLLAALVGDPIVEYAAPGYALLRLVTGSDGIEVAHLRRLERLTAAELSQYRVARRAADWIPTGERAALFGRINAERRLLALAPIDHPP